MSQKIKYYDRDMFNDKVNIKSINGRLDNIEDESKLIMPSNSDKLYGSLETMSLINNSSLTNGSELEKDLEKLNISKIDIRKQFTNYNSNTGQDIGPGKGFGNLNISNDIRNGTCTRLDNSLKKINSEKEINDRYDLINKNFQNPDNLILPFARGGDITRSNKKILENSSDTNYSFRY